MQLGLEFDQIVKVVKGKHKGKEGKAVSYHREGDGGRITLLLPDGTKVYVDKDEIDFKFDCVSILLMCEEDERLEIQQKMKDMEDGNIYS